MNLIMVTKEDQISDFPKAHNANMKEIEKAIDGIVFDLVKIKDDIEHLKIMIRED